MVEYDKVNFGNYVVKQGNSFSIRIPKIVVNTLKLRLGEKVKVSISRPKPQTFSREQISGIIKKCRKIKILNKFTEHQLTVFIHLMNSIINKRITNKEKNKPIDEKELIKQFGDKFVKDYKFFIKGLKENSNLLDFKQILRR